MRSLRRWDRPTRWTAGLLVLSALALAAVAWAAWRIAPAADAGPAAGAPAVPALPDKAPPADSTVEVAVAAAPFRPNRTPPERRYALPGEADGPDARDGRGPSLRLTGTAVRPGRLQLAAFRTGDGRSLVVETGAEIEGFRVVRVETGRVVLEGPDSTMVLEVERPDEDGGS